ncbi:MAG: sigma-54-dependent Fis family transcriptional regulator [Flavobacteriia bacterium]|nr:sigma-54-dependent Fis family transcriptional regulator [Flavobacteriia bacterium]
MPSILIAEDEAAIRRVLKNILREENGKWTIEEVEDGAQAIAQCEKEWDLLLCDIKMPQKDGTEVLKHYQEHSPNTSVVMISGHGDIELAVDCMRQGAYDFISKPPDLNRLLQTVRHALDRQQLQDQVRRLKKKVSRKYRMIGSSKPLEKVREIMEKAAPTDARVLITGPNGTGKELVAHGLHEQSARAKGPFVEVNCAAIPSELIESELFGHKKGAFTSAVKDRKGKFETAEGGTLFLDEIGDMSLSAQAKVLRALQESRVTPVGSDKDVQVNVRVLAATNKDLELEIKEGRFREDLYHRLSVINIQVPALDERKEDIPELVSHFLQQISEEQGMSGRSFADQAIVELQKLNYSGNIRQLRNLVERLMILGQEKISADDVRQFA